MLIIAIPVGTQIQVEYMIELQVCKIYCEGQTHNGNNNNNNNEVENSITTFQLIWPGGNLHITAKSLEEKESWIENIFSTICDCVEDDSGHVIGWRHQYMMGSLHSAVISRDENKVKELINKCDSGVSDSSIIDGLDEDGYSPLHYACILR